jgi:hypothetical protein
MKKFDINKSPEIIREDMPNLGFSSEVSLGTKNNYCSIFATDKEKCEEFTNLIANSKAFRDSADYLLQIIDKLDQFDCTDQLDLYEKKMIEGIKQLINTK